jgi:DNA polymerase III epsilon subunit-like protein
LVRNQGPTIDNNSNSDNNNPAEILTNSVPVTDTFITPPTRLQSTNFNINDCIYIVFDLETTGRSTERHNITELACELVDCSGSVIDDTKFSALVRPPGVIPPFISDLTGITNEMVKDKQQFDVVGIDFFKFIVQKVHEYENDTEKIITNYIFVAHNGRIFDVLFLFACIQRYSVPIPFEMLGSMYVLDTLEVSRASVKELKLTIPDNFQLSTLYTYVTNLPPSVNAHRAEADVTMLLKVLLHDNFWFQRASFIHKIDNQTGKVSLAGLGRVSEPRIPAPNDDSDTDASNTNDDDTVVEEEPTQDDPINETIEEVYGWHRNATFDGIDSTKLFNEEFQRRTTRHMD